MATLVATLTLFALQACGAPAGESSSQAAGQATSQTANEATRQADDDRGASLTGASATASVPATLTKAPSRIVSLIPAVTEIITALGAADRLIARTDFDQDPALAGLPSVGAGLTPSIEWITSLRPDLVIAWPDNRDRSLITRLDALGIPVYSTTIETLDDITATIRQVGTLLGLTTAADSIIHEIDAGFDEVRRATAGRGRPVVFYVVGHDPPLTAASGTFLDELIELAGGRNLFAELKGWPQVSLEEALHRQPDLLIVPTGEGNAPLERLGQRPGWRELDAIRGGRAYTIDALIAHRPGPRIAEVARGLARIIHPDAFPR